MRSPGCYAVSWGPSHSSEPVAVPKGPSSFTAGTGLSQFRVRGQSFALQELGVTQRSEEKAVGVRARCQIPTGEERRDRRESQEERQGAAEGPGPRRLGEDSGERFPDIKRTA